RISRSSRTSPTGLPDPGGTSTEGRKNSRTTSRDGTSSKGRRPAPAVSLAQHAGKFDPDLGRLLERVAGLAPRIRRELPVRRDPARTRNVSGEQQLELDVWTNDRFVDALRPSTLVDAASTGIHEFVQGGGPPNKFNRIEEGLRLPPKGKLYGIGGHRDKWIPEVKAFAGELERELMNLRYGGSFVGDFNQILH